MTPPRIYLVRHGETAWSLSGQHTGRTDIPITPKGEQDAASLRGPLAALHVEAVYTSPLQRARRTGELAGFESMQVIDDLIEWDYGDYDGLTTPQIHTRKPGWNLFRDGGPGGESPQEVSDRADRVIARLRAGAGNALIFSHGHFLRSLAARWIGLPISAGRSLILSPATLSILSYDHNRADEPAIELWNSETQKR